MDAIRNSTCSSETVVSKAHLGLFGFLSFLCLTPWLSPPSALALGVLFALVLGNPAPRTTRKLASSLLKTCVVFLGFSLNLSQTLHAGERGLLFAIATILVTLALGVLIGRLLEIPFQASALIAAGTAICGGSAIAAVGSVMGAEEAEMVVALGTVFILNAVALYIFPIVGHLLHLSQTQFGIWAGIAIHDISSVVGAASRYGFRALKVATAVKLSRALWIVPLCFGFELLRRKQEAQESRAISLDDSRQPKIQGSIPWFIGLFLLASLLRTVWPVPFLIAPFWASIATKGFTLTLFLVGAGLSRRMLQSVGWKPLLQGIILWMVISLSALFIVFHYRF